jgi:hypothetical protein
LVTMATAAILNFFNPSKAGTHYSGYSYKVSWSLMKRIQKMFKSPSCAFKGWFVQNGCHCHGNGQNAKKIKNTKMIIVGYSPNRNWWNMIGTT